MTNDYGSLLAIDDPKTLGLLSLGLRLMSTPGKFSTAFGQSGIGALQDVAQRTQLNRESARRDAQLRQQQEELAMRQQQASEQRKERERRMGYLASVSGQAGPPEPVNPAAALGAGVDPRELALLMPAGAEEAKPLVLSPGGMAVDPRTGKVIASAPFKNEDDKPTDVARLLNEREKFPPGHPARAIYDAALAKATSHQQAVQVNVGGPNTPGQKKLDETFAQEYADYVAKGGVSDTVKQLQQLRQASAALASDPTLTGPVRGMLPESLRSITNPKAVETRNAVEEVVQRNLRLVLGAQFTEKEGERLIARAFNPLLEPAENKRRVDRLIQQIEAAAAAKIDAARYFEKNGTLTGWQGKLPTIADIERGLESPPGKAKFLGFE